MNYGFHLSTAGLVTGMRRLDTVANNLSNAMTIGYKADVLTLEARRPENLENGGLYPDTNQALDALGGGTLFRPTSIDLTQGVLRDTGRPLDLAIEGDGFFVLEKAADNAGTSNDVLVTRAGALTRDAQGRLVLATSGAAVLGIDGNPITLEGQSADLLVDASGSIFQAGQEIGRLQLVMPADLATLRKEGRDALRIAGGKTVAAPAGTSIRQRALEESTVDSVATLAELMRISRGIDFSMRLMQYQDQMTGRMVEAFGRFA